jgi:hypothetical protein
MLYFIFIFLPVLVLFVILKATCTGTTLDIPRPSRIIPFTSEGQFVQLLHEGRPVVVAFTIKYIPIL